MQNIELLKKGDKAAIVSSARKISHSEIKWAHELFLSWGLSVVEGKTIGAECNQFAGTDSLRTQDIQSFLDDSSIRVIFFARGGYGSVRVIDNLDFSKFVSSPKWLVGYSDVTVFLLHTYYNFNLPSIHGIMPLNINETSFNSAATNSLYQTLFSPSQTREFPTCELNREGCASGVLTGGNLTILYSLLGSNRFGTTEGMILFIEDLDE